MAAASPAAGVEVLIPGLDALPLVNLTVPSSLRGSPTADGVVPPPRPASGCQVLSGEPHNYILWRIHDDSPKAIELVGMSGGTELPTTRLRLNFHVPLRPFAFLWKNEAVRGGSPTYVLYVLTITGVAILWKLHSKFSSYVSGAIIPREDVVEVDIQSASNSRITAVAGTQGCLVIGRHDGSVGCFQLGKVDPSQTGFSYEFRDIIGISRLRDLIARGKTSSAVQDIVITAVCEKKIVFVLTADGDLRAWDLSNRVKILSFTSSSCGNQGSPSKMWVGEANNNGDMLTVAILFGGSAVQQLEVVIYCFTVITGDKLLISNNPSTGFISLEQQEKLIDLRIGDGKLFMLTKSQLQRYQIIQYDYETEYENKYVMEEEFIREKLFQSSHDALDDLIWTIDSIFSSQKEDTAFNFILSILMRKLLEIQAGQPSVLHRTLLEQKPSSNSGLKFLSAARVRTEILEFIKQEGGAESVWSAVNQWKKFCSQFYQNWCQENVPYGLFIDPVSNGLCLIRKNTFSVFRDISIVEKLKYDAGISDFDADPAILYEVIHCMANVNQRLGKIAPAIYYESMMVPNISPDESTLQLLKVLENGLVPLSTSSQMTLLGADRFFAKRKVAHKSHRKFSVDILLSLHTLHSKARSWVSVLDCIEKFIEILGPRQVSKKCEWAGLYTVNSALLVQATSQIASLMFESTFTLLLLLRYLVDVGAQVSLLDKDVSRIKHKLLPGVQYVVISWLLVHFMSVSPTASPAVENFSSQLSELNIGISDTASYHKKLVNSNCTLACLLHLSELYNGQDILGTPSLLNRVKLLDLAMKFGNYMLWTETMENEASLLRCIINVASFLLRCGQYEVVEKLLGIFDRCTNDTDGLKNDHLWCSRLHLHGLSLLVLAHNEIDPVLRDQKFDEAIICFFRAASAKEAPLALQIFSNKSGFQFAESWRSLETWRLHYYQWAMHIFEQHSCIKGACQFALAALEQVDSVGLNEDFEVGDIPESTSAIRGRLWANLFKYNLDLKNYEDAYCAIISNPDEDNKLICLRHFITVLCELGATKVLCNGEIPFVGLVEKVEQELFRKAERLDVLSKSNIYKVLYTFEACKNNWRKAAAYIYRYSIRLSRENTAESCQVSFLLEERLHALSAAINALQLVDPSFAWFESPHNAVDEHYPNKRPRSLQNENTGSRMDSHVDIEILEKEYVVLSAQYLLSLQNSKFELPGYKTVENLVEILLHEHLYDTTFTIILKFWKGSEMQRELGQAFLTMARQCCSKPDNSLIHSQGGKLFLPSSEDDRFYTDSENLMRKHHVEGNSLWETLESYLVKYKELHPWLPVIVAETLLHSNPQIELPLWLVQMFRVVKGEKERRFSGMTGQVADPAALFRLYVNYGRLSEATGLLIDCFEEFSTSRPADILNRKKTSACSWFPYTAIEQLWCELDKLRKESHDADKFDRLKQLLDNSLMNHLQQVVVDSEDVRAMSMDS